MNTLLTLGPEILNVAGTHKNLTAHIFQSLSSCLRYMINTEILALIACRLFRMN